MSTELIVVVIIGLACGSAFFLVDFFSERYKLDIHISLIAGISVAYFFLLLLPEVSEGAPEYPLQFEVLEYLFILIGFTFIHVSEKFVLQKVESGTQKETRKLIAKESSLEEVEDKFELLLAKEIEKENGLDLAYLKEIAHTVTDLYEQGKEIKEKIVKYKKKIHDHINKELDEIEVITNYIYHFIIGFILVSVLLISFVTGIFFFIFAFFRAVISNRKDVYVVFSDLDITVEHHHTPLNKFLGATATLTGVILSIILSLLFPINLELVYILFSFISGVILYTIVREVIPEKEKGKPIMFLIGVIGFSMLVIILRYLQVALLPTL